MAQAHEGQPILSGSHAAIPAFAELIDLASERLGGKALVANDEFFAGKENLLKPERAVFIAGKFTDRGKWMDGWESRRRREPGHDWCIIKLGLPGIIRGFNVDTAHFNGNQPEACTVEAVEMPADATTEQLLKTDVSWTAALERTLLGPSAEHLMPASAGAAGKRVTHVRLNIFPDGGVARFRVHGDVLPDWATIRESGEVIDLGAAVNGGLVVACNDMHFGSRHNLIMPGRAANMGDGWETRRKRGLTGGEHDWAIVRLGSRGQVAQIEVDTNHFKGNFPDSCMLECCDAPGVVAPGPDADWRTLVTRTKLTADAEHYFKSEMEPSGPCTHVRLKIFPDGGVSRLRLFGTLA